MPVRDLSPVLAEKARIELNEDPNRLEDDLQHLKDWIAKQPHLRARTDDQWLVAFLRGSKFSLEGAKQKMDLFYSLKATAPELNRINYNEPKFDEILSLGSVIVMPKQDNRDGEPRLMLVRPGKYNSEKYDVLDFMSVWSAVQKILMMEDDNVMIEGMLPLMDFADMTMTHVMRMNPTSLKKLTIAAQDATPVKMNACHVINTPPGFETMFNLIRNAMNEENKSKIYIHNTNFEELYKHIPKEILPTEYGGFAGNLEEAAEYWKKKIQENSAFLEEEKQFGTDESKRPGKPRTAEDLFGIEGSFRKLELD